MTLVLAFKDRNTIYLAGDRMWSCETSREEHASPKIFTPEEGISFGFTSSYLLGELLRYQWACFTFERRNNWDTLDEFVHTDLRQSFIACFKNNHYGYSKKADADAPEYGDFLFVLDGVLYKFNADTSILKYDEIVTIGCGADLALASYHALKGISISPEEKINRIFQSVAITNPYVGEQHDVIKVPSIDEPGAAIEKCGTWGEIQTAIKRSKKEKEVFDEVKKDTEEYDKPKPFPPVLHKAEEKEQRVLVAIIKKLYNLDTREVNPTYYNLFTDSILHELESVGIHDLESAKAYVELWESEHPQSTPLGDEQ